MDGVKNPAALREVLLSSAGDPVMGADDNRRRIKIIEAELCIGGDVCMTLPRSTACGQDDLAGLLDRLNDLVVLEVDAVQSMTSALMP